MSVFRMRGFVVAASAALPLGFAACVAVPDYQIGNTIDGDDAQAARDVGDAGSVHDTSNSHDGSADAYPGDTSTRDGGTPDAASVPRIVFVTSTTTSGAIGGLASADSRCKGLANSSGSPGLLGRNWRAWLSTSTVQARDRIPTVGGAGSGIAAYQLVGGGLVFPEGFVFGPNPGDAGGTTLPLRIIDQDERGQVVPRSGVWTGTQNDGTRCGSSAPGFCDDWTTTANGSCYGILASVSAWSAGSGGGATTLNHLYCFEIP